MALIEQENVSGPHQNLEKFNACKIWFTLKQAVEFTYQGRVRRLQQLYLDAVPDLKRLIESDHFDYDGSNIFASMTQQLIKVPDLIQGLEFRGVEPEDLSQLTLTFPESAHPVSMYIWKWIGHYMANSTPNPGPFSSEGIDQNQESRSLVRGPPEIVEKFYKTGKVWFHFREGENIELNVQGSVRTEQCLYLDLGPDLGPLLNKKQPHWDYYGENVFQSVRAALNNRPDLLARVTIGGLTPEECSQLTLVQQPGISHPIIIFIWAKISQFFRNEDQVGDFNEEPEENKEECPILCV